MLFPKRVTAAIVALSLTCTSLPASAWAGPGREHRGQSDRHDNYKYHRPPYGHRLPRLSGKIYQLGVGGGVFFYSEGIYYRRAGREYIVVEPPLGAVVRTLPPYYQIVSVNGVGYYLVEGTYYINTAGGFQVVSAPVIVAPARTQIVSVPATENRTKVAEGITLGTILGAVTGGIIGYQRKGNDAARGALIGGVLGATAGGVIGAQVPNQTEMSRAVSPEPAGLLSFSDAGAESYTVNVPHANGSGYVPVLLRKSGEGFLGPQGEYYPEFPKITQLQLMYAR